MMDVRKDDMKSDSGGHETRGKMGGNAVGRIIYDVDRKNSTGMSECGAERGGKND